MLIMDFFELAYLPLYILNRGLDCPQPCIQSFSDFSRQHIYIYIYIYICSSSLGETLPLDKHPNQSNLSSLGSPSYRCMASKTLWIKLYKPSTYVNHCKKTLRLMDFTSPEPMSLSVPTPPTSANDSSRTS
eukprot:Gb_04967 [translate_table: standard]